MKVIFFFLLLNIAFSININKFYRKQFTKEIGYSRLQLTNETSQSELPIFKTTENIPENTTLLKIDKNQILISCSKYPYDELLFQYINQYFSKKRINSSFYSELFNLIVKILFYKYAPLESIKEELKSSNISEKEEYEYKLSSHLMEYIDVIYSQLNSNKYNFDINKINKEFIQRYKIQENFFANELYDDIIEAAKLNKNEKILGFIKSFLFDRKDEFIKLFYYININGFSIAYPQYEEFYLGKTNITNYRKSNHICVYISPITDMLDTKVNVRNRMYSFIAFPVLNQSIILYTKNHINMKDDNGLITKHFTVTNENMFFQYNYLFDDYKKFNFNKYYYSKQIDVIIPKKILDGETNKKLTTCKIMNICRGIIPNDDSTYKMLSFISTSRENPNLLNFARLLYLDEQLLDEEKKSQFQIFIRSFTHGEKINDENELLAYIFYYQQLNREIETYKEFFNDIINKKKEIEKNKDLFKLIELNLNVILKNYNIILDKMEVILNNVIDSI